MDGSTVQTSILNEGVPDEQDYFHIVRDLLQDSNALLETLNNSYTFDNENSSIDRHNEEQLVMIKEENFVRNEEEPLPESEAIEPSPESETIEPSLGLEGIEPPTELEGIEPEAIDTVQVADLSTENEANAEVSVRIMEHDDSSQTSVKRRKSKRIAAMSSDDSQGSNSNPIKREKKKSKRRYSEARAVSPTNQPCSSDDNAICSTDFDADYRRLMQEANDILDATGVLDIEKHFGQQLLLLKKEAVDLETSSICEIFPNQAASNPKINCNFMNSRISPEDLQSASTSYDGQHESESFNQIMEQIEDCLCRTNALIETANQENLSDTIYFDETIHLQNSPVVEVPEMIDIAPSSHESVSSSSPPTNAQVDDDVIFVEQLQPRVVDVIDLCSTPTVSASTSIKRRVEKLKVNAVIELNDSLDEPPPSTSTSKQGGEQKCPICFDPRYNDKATATKCGHIFCEDCIKHALRLSRTCPICKRRAEPKNLLKLFF